MSSKLCLTTKENIIIKTTTYIKTKTLKIIKEQLQLYFNGYSIDSCTPSD